jgi:lipid II:glycine glycyltransferase (peptidoglycan interpeptide bridge formation enzyme)
MNKWICTKEKKWFERWNSFILADQSSSFIQSIYRVKAYEKYGMEWELLLCIDQEENIIVGSANILVKLPFFKLYICSYGPTKKSDLNQLFDDTEFINRFINRGKELNAFVSQITIPIHLSIKECFNAVEGKIFSNISNPKYSNIIDLKINDKWLSKEELIDKFSPKGRRDVRSSYRKGLTCQYPLLETDLRTAYLCFENNARSKGYYVRPWNDMREFVVESVKNKMAFVITAWHENKLQGAIFLERSNNTLNYTMGGVYRNNPDLQTGYFLQLEGMLLARILNLTFYDISYGGPSEVQRFKSMFNPILKERYKTIHFINNHLKYLIFNKLYNRFKYLLPKLVSLFKR